MDVNLFFHLFRLRFPLVYINKSEDKSSSTFEGLETVIDR